MSHPITIATMGKFMGPHRKTVTGHPPPEEVTDHKFPKAEVTNIESEDLSVKVNLISDGEDYD